MPFIDKFKKLIGLSSEGEYEGLDDYKESESPLVPVQQSNEVAAQRSYETPTITSDTVDVIFQTVVEVFNSSLPGFIGDSINADLQRKYLYNKLDDSVKAYLASLENQVRSKCELEWDKERAKYDEEAKALKHKAEELETKKSDLKEQNLSAVRQKRAMADRIRDLEAQVMKLEAEKEQYELETKAMANKAKAAAVMEEELLKIRDGKGEQSFDSHLAMLNKQLESENQDLKAEINRLTETIDTIKLKENINDAMSGDFKKQAAEATKSNKDLLDKVARLEEELKVKNAQIDDLKMSVEERDVMLGAETVSKEEIEEIQSQISLFESVKSKLEDRIIRLKDNLTVLKEENDSLKSTIKENLIAQANQEKELNSQINGLELELQKLRTALKSIESSTDTQSEHIDNNNKTYGNRNKRKKRRGRDQSRHTDTASTDVSAVEEILNGTEWLIPRSSSNSKSKAKAGDDFGYQPPQSKPTPLDNDAQMTLFDFE